MRTFSKSKLLALRQCPKRLWLEIHRPDLRGDSAATQASFQVGHQVGDIARRIYDPEGLGAVIDVQSCWRRLNLDSACRFFFDRGLVANV